MKSIVLRCLALAVGALLICSCWTLAASAVSATMILRYRYAVGQQFGELVRDTFVEYASFVDPKIGGKNLTLTQTDSVVVTYRVAKVYADGSAQLYITYRVLTITTKGVTQAIPTAGYIDQVKISPTGQLLDHQLPGAIYPIQGPYDTPSPFDLFDDWPKYAATPLAASAGTYWSAQFGPAADRTVWHFALNNTPTGADAMLAGSSLESWSHFTDPISGYEESLLITRTLQGQYALATGMAVAARTSYVAQQGYWDATTGANEGYDTLTRETTITQVPQ